MTRRLRSAGALDIDAVMAVMDAAFDPSFGEAWNRAQCLGILALTDVWLIVAEEDVAGGRVRDCAGFALARRMVDEAELLLLAVRPLSRGRGHGRALVEATAAEARSRGAARLMLEMREDNPAAALYAATDFTPVGRRRAYYRGADGTFRDAITLVRALAPITP